MPAWLTALLATIREALPLFLAYLQGRKTEKIKGIEKGLDDARNAKKSSDINSRRSASDAHRRLQELSKR